MFSEVLIFAAAISIAMASLPMVIQPVHHAPQPYKFGYDIKDKHSEQYRQESGNGDGGVAGSYGFTDARGVKRQVDYVADHAGFRAAVKTNEPGTANQNPAAVQMVSAAPYAGGVAALGGIGLGYGGVVDGRIGVVRSIGGVVDGRIGLTGPIGSVVDGRIGLAGPIGGIVDGRIGLAGPIGIGGLGILGGLGYARYGY